MLTEIDAASDFLCQYVPIELQFEFKEHLKVILQQKYDGHWVPDYPMQGNGYRAVNVIQQHLDDVLLNAASQIYLQHPESYFPEDFVLWVDPNMVSYRIGDFGYITTVYESRPKVTLRSPDRPSDPPIELGKGIKLFRPASPPRTPSPQHTRAAYGKLQFVAN